MKTSLAIVKEGIPADGEEPAFPPQPNMMGTGDLAYQQKVAGDIGGGCKAKNHFYTHCACTSTQYDLLSYVTGELRCPRCIRDHWLTCAHQPVNNQKELHRKGLCLLDLLLEDFAKREKRDLDNVAYHDMMSSEEVQCYGGYDSESRKIMEPRFLHDAKINDEIINGDNVHLYNYVRDILHTEEEPSIIEATKIKYDQNAMNKSTDTTNINFDFQAPDVDTLKLDLFTSNLSQDLRL